MSINIIVTGANGAIGSEVINQLSSSELDLKIKALVRSPKRITPFLKKINKKHKGLIEFVYGDLTDKEVCKNLVKDADYVFHFGGLIPPRSEVDAEVTIKSNVGGTQNMVDAVKESGRNDKIKFLYMGTVAEYGNRTPQHPWGRVGDPLISSAFDYYSHSKIKAERYVLDAELPNWVSVRQTAVAHKYIFKNNLSSGLMFQTVLDEPYEWITDVDTGIMIRHLVEYDQEKKLEGFWNQIYNIGGGISCRNCGYEVLNEGFKLMGRSIKDLFDPNWIMTRNFHGMWFADSDILENWLHFRTESIKQFWVRMGRKYWYFKFAKYLPKSWIRKMVFYPLLKCEDAPIYWVNNKIDDKVYANYGGYDKFNAIPKDWKHMVLFAESPTYEDAKIKDLYAHRFILNHGFDESKPKEELDIKDMEQAAKFRGGHCLSKTMTKGDLYTKLKWVDHKGNEFMASPYTILFGGFWSPFVAEGNPWEYGPLAKVAPFYEQIYKDDFSYKEFDIVFDDKK